MTRTIGLLAALVAATSLAEVGKVSALEGTATRTPKGSPAQKLAIGAAIELHDALDVAAGGNLKLELTDGSVVMLAEKSHLVITEAEFEGLERKGFKAFLQTGSLWTRVKKALGGGAFEVSTERAVAGVRGTVFRIDADTLMKAAAKKGRRASVVRVIEGVVTVRPSAALARTMSRVVASKAPKGSRVQVPGPQEVSVDEWERRFVELQQNQQVAVGEDLWEQAELDAAAQADAFSRWIEQNSK